MLNSGRRQKAKGPICGRANQKGLGCTQIIREECAQMQRVQWLARVKVNSGAARGGGREAKPRSLRHSGRPARLLQPSSNGLSFVGLP